MKKFSVFILSIMIAVMSCPAALADEAQTAEPACEKVVYLCEPEEIEAPSSCWYAWTWGESEGKWIRGEYTEYFEHANYIFSGVEGNVVFACMYDENAAPAWDSATMWRQTVNLTVDGFNNEFVITGCSGTDSQKLTGCWVSFDEADYTAPSAATLPTDSTAATEPTAAWETQTTQGAAATQPTGSTNPTQAATEKYNPTSVTYTPTPTQKAQTINHNNQITEPTDSKDIDNAQAIKTGDVGKPSLNLSTATVKCGKVITIKVRGAGKKKVTFSSGNKAVAKVSSKGKVSALKRGFAKITVKVGKKKLYFTIKVTSSPKLSKTSVKVKKGGKVKIIITGKASTVKNSYADTKYARITSGRAAAMVTIVGKKRGGTTLRIRVNGVLFKVKVRVV